MTDLWGDTLVAMDWIRAVRTPSPLRHRSSIGILTKPLTDWQASSGFARVLAPGGRRGRDQGATVTVSDLAREQRTFGGGITGFIDNTVTKSEPGCAGATKAEAVAPLSWMLAVTGSGVTIPPSTFALPLPQAPTPT